MKKELMILNQQNEMTFENLNLGFKVRTIEFEDKTIGINAEDTAKGFGWTRMKNNKEYIMWDRVNVFLKDFNFPHKCGKGDYIPESVFYLLGMKANNKTAQEFQKWLAIDVIPSIRKNGEYKQLDKKDSLILSLVKDGGNPLELAEYTKLVEQEGIAKGLNGESRLMNLGQVVKILNQQYLENKNLTTMMLNEFFEKVLGWGKFKIPKGNKVRREFIPNKKFIKTLVVKGGSYTGKTDKNNKIKVQYSVDMVDHILKYKGQLEQFISENI